MSHSTFTLSAAAAAAAAAAAKSLQSYPTLCDPIDGSPPGSAVPGILQARTLEWITISCISEVIDISPSNLDSSLRFLQPSISHDIFCI